MSQLCPNHMLMVKEELGLKKNESEESLSVFLSLDLIGVSSVLMLGPVRSIGEGFVAAFVFAHIRFLPSMRAKVSLQVFQTRVGLITAFKLQQKHKTLSGQHRINSNLATIISVLMTHGQLTVHLCGFSPVCLRI